MMRAGLKRLAESALLHGGPATFTRRGIRGRTLVLAYHNIIPPGASPGRDESLHLPQDAFARQLDLITQFCEACNLEEVLGPPTGHRRPRVVITFDDAYQGALRLGVMELRKRGLPATIFVSPGFVGGRSFWWDAITELGSNTLSPSARNSLLVECRGEDAAARDWALRLGWKIQEPETYCVAATEGELRSAAGEPGITLASHTWSHPNLTRIPPDQLDQELRRPLEWLHSRFDRVIDWITYPYGISSPPVEEAVRRAGYRGALRVDGGWLPLEPQDSLFRLPRFNVPAAISLDGFALRLAGMFAN